MYHTEIIHLPPAAYLEYREGGRQGLGGRHFTQGVRPTVVIGWTLFGGSFRRLRAP